MRAGLVLAIHTWRPLVSVVCRSSKRLRPRVLAFLRLLCLPLAFAVLLPLLSTPTPGAQAVVPGANGKIAFVEAHTPAPYDLIVIDSNGQNRQTVVSKFNLRYPAWSPDGTKIAFAAANSGFASSPIELFIYDTTNNQVTQLTNSPGGTSDRINTQPTWSPDGSRLAFISTRDRTTLQTDLYVMPAVANGSVTRLTTSQENVSITEPDWSPDGSLIAFSQSGGPTSSNDPGGTPTLGGIYTIDPSTRAITRLTTNVSFSAGGTFGAHKDLSPKWSPNGQQMAFRSDFNRTSPNSFGSNGTVFIMNRNGSGINRLTAIEEFHNAISFSPDGTQLVSAVKLGNADRINIATFPLSNPANRTFINPSPTTEQSDPTWQASSRSTECVGPTGLNTCLLEPGDILLETPTDPNNFIAGVEGFISHWFHAAIYDGNGNKNIIEAPGSSPSAPSNEVRSIPVEQSSFYTVASDWVVIRLSDRSKVNQAITFARFAASEDSAGNPRGRYLVGDLPFFLNWVGIGNKNKEQALDETKSQRKFYCSMLVWASYKSQGIDLDTNITNFTLDDPVSPDDLYGLVSKGKATIVQQKKRIIDAPIRTRRTVFLASPADLRILDNRGNVTGVGSNDRMPVSGIPDSYYSAQLPGYSPDTEPEWISFAEVRSEMTVQVRGTGTGPYRLIVQDFTESGDVQRTDFSGTTSPGQVDTYTLPGPSGSTPVASNPSNPSRSEDDTDKPRKLTEEQQQQRQRTNRSNKDDEHTEGNIVGLRLTVADPIPAIPSPPGGFIVDPDAVPYILIVNRDGLQQVKLLGDAKAVGSSIRVGDYLEADGVKQSEQLFEADSVDVIRDGHRVR